MFHEDQVATPPITSFFGLATAETLRQRGSGALARTKLYADDIKVGSEKTPKWGEGGGTLAQGWGEVVSSI